ncbi:MAG: mycofactocin biosynthesis chaperone MftB [Actinomycetota bacterium]|nr:mycofactocin biosynthesis chaperone MftB [Actinomycetota bacterium]
MRGLLIAPATASDTAAGLLDTPADASGPGDGASTGGVDAFDPSRPYTLHPRVALRPEPFGALAYHYGNRRLNFLRSHDLVALVEDLGNHPSVDAALAASGIAERRHPAFRTALARLAASDFLTVAPHPNERPPADTPET